MAAVSYPPVPPQASYTSCYCEENIYLLAASFLEMPDFRESWDLSVVFISNCTKTVSDILSRPCPCRVRAFPTDGGRLFGSSLLLHRLMVEKLRDTPRQRFGASERPVQKGSRSCGIITLFLSSGLCSTQPGTTQMTEKIATRVA